MTLSVERNGKSRPTRNESVAHYQAWDPFTLARDLLRWDPYREGGSVLSRPLSGRAIMRFAPSFEVKEREDAFVLSADLPGLRDEDVQVTLHGNVLTVSGTRSAEDRKEGETYYLYERQYGTFSRSFTLPDSANGDSISADLSAGVLTLVIPKKEETKPRKISIGAK
jgi:HSP20 family protein